MSMRPKHAVTASLGGALIIVAIAFLAVSQEVAGLAPLMIGLTLVYLGYRPGRGALILFGHACIVAGCLFVTWGVYLLPHSEAILSHILGRPLFWGLFSIFGGICAIQHGSCRCISTSRRGGECPGAAGHADPNPSKGSGQAA